MGMSLVSRFFLTHGVEVGSKPVGECLCPGARKHVQTDGQHENIMPYHIGWVDHQTKVEICISTYSNADVVCYSATSRTELNERNSVRQIVDRS